MKRRQPHFRHRRSSRASPRADRLAKVVDSSQEAILASDREGRVTAWNRAAERLYGYPAEEALGRPSTFLTPPERIDEAVAMRRRILSGQRVDEFQTEHVRRDGGRVTVALSAGPIRDRRGRVVGITTIHRDVSERVRLESERARLAALVEHSADAIVAVDAGGRVTAWNHGAAMLYGISEREALGRVADELVPTTNGQDPALPPELVRGHVIRRESTRRRRDGSVVVISSTLSPIRDRRGNVTGAVGVSRDVTLQRQAEAQLHEATALFAAAFAHAPVGMALISLADGLIVEANPALCAMLGYEERELIGSSARRLVHAEDRVEMEAGSQDLRTGRVVVSGESRYLHRDGGTVWTHASAALVGDLGYVVLHLIDISERRHYEGQVRYLADHDALTGLYNRRRFQEELEWIVAHGRRSGEPAAVLAVDIDHFKYINDTYGHAAGDELLTWVATTLRDRVRKTDILARLGGDMFGVILPNTPAAGAAKIADALLSAARERAPDGRARTSLSIGITLVDPEKELDAAELLADAEIALFDAKERGRDRVAVTGAGGAAPERLRTHMTWAERIRRALEGEGFVLYEQPIVGVRSGVAERSELLIRMRSDDGGVIAPGEFLPIAERFGLMKAIDRWVIMRAIRLLAERQAAGYGQLGVDVNLSGESITDPSFMDFIAAEVRNAPIDPTSLIFEVTETSAIVNMDRARTLARRLAELGCQFALDDFGAGFGSFYYLKHLPFDMVKIDGDFIKALPSSHTDQLTVRAIVQIAQGLGKQTTAEFVGDDETVALLSELGVDFAQGYHVGKPRPVETRPAFALRS